MPETEHVGSPEHSSEHPSEFLLDELRHYSHWKREVPAEIRGVVEGAMLGKVRVPAVREETESVRAFYRGMAALLTNPQMDVATLEASAMVRKQLAALQKVAADGGTTNVFAALADKRVDFGVKKNFVEAKVLPRLEFLRGFDRRASEQAARMETTGETPEEEYTPHRAPKQEGEGSPSEAVATVAPYFGGLYMDAAFDRFDSATLTWRASPRREAALGEQTLDVPRARAYRSVVQQGIGRVKLPRGWSADAASVKWLGEVPSAFEVRRDGRGLVRVVTEGEGSYPFEISIAPSPDAVDPAPPEGEVGPVNDVFPEELSRFVREVFASSLSFGAKVRRVASRIKSHLEYDMDVQWEAVYKADASKYFEKIWENKKAKCDEANTLLARMLASQGVHTLFIKGHSVRAKSPAGEALLLESNRHGWTYAWDDEEGVWIRLDATPAGDPNVDEEEQEEELGEGDYGEQEAEMMSEEELEKRIQAAQAQEEEHERLARPEVNFAKEAGCSPEEAGRVLEKIRLLRERHARVLGDADRLWQTLVRKNMREVIVDRGPVALSQMDDMDPDEVVSGFVEVLAGEQDPLIGEREDRERKTDHWFGGYEVYVAADMSGSMDETVGGAKKSDMQRDMVFLLVDSCMSAAVEAGQSERKLQAPMPVRVSVAAFGAKTEIVLPLTERWGSKEQVRLYRALDAGAGGGTPDDVALAMLREAIAGSRQKEEQECKANPKYGKHGWAMRRFVIAVADGGSNNGGAVQQANDALKADGIPVDLFLISPEGDKNLQKVCEQNYQSVTPISDVRQLADQALRRLTSRISDVYKT